MKNISLNETEFKASVQEITAITQQIKVLEESREQYYQTLDRLVRQCLIDYDWQPYYNEKAVRIVLDDQVAWHLWYLEKTGDCFRFREVPNDFPHIRNYYRQEILPLEINDTHGWIVPLSLFQELNKFMTYNVYPDKHESYKL